MELIYLRYVNEILWMLLKNKFNDRLNNKSQVPKNKSWIIVNESQALRNNSQVTRNEGQLLRNNSLVIRDELHELRNEAHVLRDNDKTKTLDNTIIDKINSKVDLINKIDKILSEVNIKLTNNVKSIYEAMHEVQDEIYNDPWLWLVELNKIKDILDDALNVIWYEIYEKNRISSNIINIDKYNDIDGYVSKLTDVINNEIQLINKIGETINHIRHEINNKTNMVNEIIHKASVMDNDTLHLIDDKLDKIIRQTRKKIKIMLENTITPEAKTEDTIDKTKDTTDNTKDSTDNTKNTIDNSKNIIDNTEDIITLPKTIIEKYKSELDETIKNIDLIYESFACEKFMNKNFDVIS